MVACDANSVANETRGAVCRPRGLFVHIYAVFFNCWICYNMDAAGGHLPVGEVADGRNEKQKRVGRGDIANKTKGAICPPQARAMAQWVT